MSFKFCCKLPVTWSKNVFSNKQNLANEGKIAQTLLIETMTLNKFLIRLGCIIRASNPNNMITAIGIIKRELQLKYVEMQ